METIVFTVRDLMNRYRVSDTVARKMMREIRSYNGGGSLPAGRVFEWEAVRWEHRKEQTSDRQTDIQDNQ